MFNRNYAVVITALVALCFADFDPFSDSIPFSIKWKGAIDNQQEIPGAGKLIRLQMTTPDKHKYECSYYQEDNSEGADALDKLRDYQGPSASDLLTAFSQRVGCSYRLESYWSYELCHGKSIRQYHEEKDPASDDGISVTQDYTLGLYTKESGDLKKGQVDAELTPPVVLLEKSEYPYYSVVYTGGTECDLTGIHRTTTIRYICHEAGRGDVYEIKETSTCEYTAIVLVSDLCQHPAYQMKTETSREISCHALDGSPTKPKVQQELDEMLERRARAVTDRKQIETAVSGGSHTAAATAPTTYQTKEDQEATRTDLGSVADDKLIADILSGEYCIQGGAGWWSYDFCYGEHAKQFHVEKNKRVAEILLGSWNEPNHLKWLANHPGKRPRPEPHRKFITMFYSNGDVCDETGKPRQVEVKLKCATPIPGASSQHAVAIYLLEPTICEYILTIESSILCKVIKMADDNGLIKAP